MELRQVEWNQETRVKMVSILKENTTSSSLATLVAKTEQAKGVFVVDVKGTFLNEPKEKVFASISISMLSLIILLSCYAQAIKATLVSLGTPPNFDPLKEFQFHLEKKYGDFRRDQMQRVLTTMCPHGQLTLENMQFQDHKLLRL